MCVFFYLFFIAEKANVEKMGTFCLGDGFWTKRCWKTRCRTAKSSCVDQLSPTDFFRGLEDPKVKKNRENWEDMELLCFYAFFNLLELTYGLGFRVSLPKTLFESMIFLFPLGGICDRSL